MRCVLRLFVQLCYADCPGVQVHDSLRVPVKEKVDGIVGPFITYLSASFTRVTGKESPSFEAWKIRCVFFDCVRAPDWVLILSWVV